MSKRKSKAEREREARAQAKFHKDEAAVKRCERRLVRAFGAWQRAQLQLKRTIKRLETEPPLGKGPPELMADASGWEPLDDAHKLGSL